MFINGHFQAVQAELNRNKNQSVMQAFTLKLQMKEIQTGTLMKVHQ